MHALRRSACRWTTARSWGLCHGELPDPVPPPAASSSSSGSTSDAGQPESCAALVARSGVKPIYSTGSSNFPPFVKAVAPLLAAHDPPYGMVWQTSNSCQGVDVAFNSDPQKRLLARTSLNTGLYSVGGDGAVTVIPCTIDEDVPVDFGESDIYSTTCEQRLKYSPTNPVGSPLVGEYFGPIQAMTFSVPAASSQSIISAEAARAVFGRGSAPTPELPWNDSNQLFKRSDSTATNQLISRAIFIDPTQWYGQTPATATAMASALQAVPSDAVERTIGILGTDGADANRGNLKTLAFQARGQSCAFWPDSTPFAVDKRNVRDGHYAIWGPLHFFARLVNGQPNEAAGAFVLGFAAQKLDQSLLRSIAATANVPACAMKVRRTIEMGPMEPYQPPFACGCFYDSVVTSGDPAGCTKCTGTQDCPQEKPACNYGFCEAQ